MATDGYMRFFPYERPYENQREAIDRIDNALSRGQDVLFEGACGTGKTLSALVPALSHAREHDRTVVITTNVHQQMRQFVEEARAITNREPVRAAVFKGKASMCHIDVGYEECQALRDNVRRLVEQERDAAQLERRQQELLDLGQAGDQEAAAARSAVMEELDALEENVTELRDAAICERYYENLTGEVDGFYRWLFEDVRTPTEIYDRAHERGFCGYELLKEGLDGVELVVCNYHHLLDPTIREQFFRWLGRDPSEVIAVFDEAHNVEDAAREHATRTLAEPTLDGALDELEGLSDHRVEPARNLVTAFRTALTETYENGLGFGDVERVGDNWRDVPIAKETGRDDLTLAFLDAYSGRGIDPDVEDAISLGNDLEERYVDAYRNGETETRRECRVLPVARFVRLWMAEGTATGKYPVVSVRRDGGTDRVYGRAELYTCIPREVAGDLFGELYATVLMSATLRPFDVLSDVLGLGDPVTMAYGLEFPPENRRTFAVDTPALFASARDDREVQDAIAGALEDAIRMTPGNVLCFFPSYREATRYYNRLDGEITSTLYHDEPGESAEELRERFVADDDGALFTSLWATLAEGVSFDGDDARGVVVVGVPYPRLDERMEAVQDAYEEAYGGLGREAGWEYAVEAPTIRKTRQAMGRVLRSPEEVGVRILLDERYTEAATRSMRRYAVRDAFPQEERAEMLDVAQEKLKFAMLNFFTDHGLYEDEPPRP